MPVSCTGVMAVELEKLGIWWLRLGEWSAIAVVGVAWKPWPQVVLLLEGWMRWLSRGKASAYSPALPRVNSLAPGS